MQIPYHACPMSVHTPDHEPSLFDLKPALAVAKEPEPPLVSSAAAESDAEPESASSELAPGEEQETPRSDRKRLAEQLDALRKKEAELLRALAITDHPDLADAIRTIEARVYCVARADAKLAQGLSKSEARRQEVLTKKLTALREKRSELDTQITALEAESQELGSARLSDFERERQDALQELMVALATHDPALDAAGLDVRSLLPELGALMPELEGVARSVSGARADA
jgi:chromosome segregation ATPase